jgi:hypothetical protein
MTQAYAEGLPVERRADTAVTNEEFTGIVTRLDAAKRESGWDPYEVWRTRVRAPARAARVRKDRPRDPRR